MWQTAECRDARCNAQIIWAVTGRRKAMPVDVEPCADGNVLLTGSDQTVPLATVVDPDSPPLGGWPGPLHRSHFATCVGADDFRHKRRTTR
jgi:hypothetical protein